MKPLDVLVLSPHPDDAELGCGGTLASLVKRGYRVGIADLTRGELGSRGSPEIREKEASEASRVLGLTTRMNLGLPDGHLGNDRLAHSTAVAECIRSWSPKVVLIPAADGRHPDHDEAAALARRSLFIASLKKWDSPSKLPAIKPPSVLEYPTRRQFSPSFVLDVSSVYDLKLSAIRAYSSQLGTDGTKGAPTLMSSPLTLEAVQARDTLWGVMIGCARGEGFRSASPLRIDDPVAFFEQASTTNALLFPEPL